jgi:hypothetical protein
MNEFKTIYASSDRVCLGVDGIIIHAERKGKWIEARTLGTGGPMSGDLIAKSENGLWVVSPSDPDFQKINDVFGAASRILRERSEAPTSPGF